MKRLNKGEVTHIAGGIQRSALNLSKLAGPVITSGKKKGTIDPRAPIDGIYPPPANPVM